jgi:esterase/lipase
VGKARTPMIVINAEEDHLARRTEAQVVIEKIKNPLNRLVVIGGTNHTTISIDFEKSMKVIG